MASSAAQNNDVNMVTRNTGLDYSSGVKKSAMGSPSSQLIETAIPYAGN
jgi:hypothetical protein